MNNVKFQTTVKSKHKFKFIGFEKFRPRTKPIY